MGEVVKWKSCSQEVVSGIKEVWLEMCLILVKLKIKMRSEVRDWFHGSCFSPKGVNNVKAHQYVRALIMLIEIPETAGACRKSWFVMMYVGFSSLGAFSTYLYFKPLSLFPTFSHCCLTVIARDSKLLLICSWFHFISSFFFLWWWRWEKPKKMMSDMMSSIQTLSNMT